MGSQPSGPPVAPPDPHHGPPTPADREQGDGYTPAPEPDTPEPPDDL
jgi:hypothetical protein